MLKSYSKINLFLKVLKKNSEGLHNIQSTTMLIDLYDDISIKKIDKNKDQVIFTGPFKRNINRNSNTIISTLAVLRSQNLLSYSERYRIIVNKNIPIFAGLGGGTGNAVTIIKFFKNNCMIRSFS